MEYLSVFSPNRCQYKSESKRNRINKSSSAKCHKENIHLELKVWAYILTNAFQKQLLEVFSKKGVL